MTAVANYGMGIFDEHQQLLHDSAISIAVARERGYVSVDEKTRLAKVGFSKTQQRVPGLLIPVHGVDGEIVQHEYRPDKPREHDGKVVKYESPYNMKKRLDVHPYVFPQLCDTNVGLWITEGARKVDAAITAGFACVGIPGVWAWKGEEVLADLDAIAWVGRHVKLAFDADVMTNEKVRSALRALSAELTGRGAHVEVVVLPDLGDGHTGLDDYLAAGHSVDELHTCNVDELPSTNGDDEDEDVSWQPVDLRPHLDGAVEVTKPSVLQREDGTALLYRGAINGLHGDSGSGKSWVATYAAAQEMGYGFHVGVIDFEDRPSTIIERLRLLGVNDDVIAERLHYFGPVEPASVERIDVVIAHLAPLQPSLIIIDSLGEAFGLQGVDEDRDIQVGPWLREVPRRLAEATGAAVCMIDHSTKANSNPLHPSGSKRKRAAISGASYLVEAVVPFAKGADGKLVLTAAKDRHGHYRRGDRAATLVMTANADRNPTMTCWPPTPGEESPEADMRRGLAAKYVAALKAAERSLSLRGLLDVVTTKAGRDRRIEAIGYAVDDGAIRVVEQGSAHLHHYVRDLRAPTSENTEEPA